MCANNPAGRNAPLSKSALRDPKFVAFTGPNVGSAREVVDRVKSMSLFLPNMAICVDTFQNDSTPDSYSNSADVEDSDVLHFTAHGWPAVRDTARYNPSHALVDAGLLLHHGGGKPTSEDQGELLTLLSIQGKRLSRCRLAFIMACDGAVGREDSACDDSFSIGTSFIVAGARHVVCILWPVKPVASILIGRRFYENLGWMRGELPSTASRRVESLPQTVSACLLEAQRWYRGLGDPAAQALELFPTREDLRLALLTQNKLRGDLAGDTETDEANWAGYICMGPVEVDERHPCP
jgi:hypothetical protein